MTVASARVSFVSILVGALAMSVVVAPASRANPDDVTITGVISDAQTGKPLANACDVVARVLPNEGRGVLASSTCLDDQGSYRFQGIPYNSNGYVVFIRSHTKRYASRYYGPEEHKGTGYLLTPGPGEVATANVALDGKGMITGQVTRASDGVPYARDCSVTVTAQPTTTNSYYNDLQSGAYGADIGGRYNPCVDSHGRYRLLVPPGPYKIQFQRAGVATQWWPGRNCMARAGIFLVTADRVTAHVSAALLRGGHVVVRLVHGSTGKPFRNFSVGFQLYDSRHDNGRGLVAEVGGRTDSQGYFRIWHQQPGNDKLEAFPPYDDSYDSSPPPPPFCQAWYDKGGPSYYGEGGSFSDATTFRIRRNTATRLTVRVQQCS